MLDVTPVAASRAFALTALSIAIALALAVPILRSPDTQLFGFELVGRHHDPFTVMEQYAGGSVPSPFLQPATDVLGISFARMMPALAAYNLMTLMTFPLSAVAAYAHARHVIGSATGAVVAAILFMMAPFHLAHAAYHVHIAQVQWLPLCFLALWRLLERPNAGRALTFGAALLLVTASSFYFGFIAIAVTPAAMLAYIWLARRRQSAMLGIAAVWAIATLAIVGGALLLATWIWLPQVFVNASALAFPKEALDQHSARAFSYLLPHAGHVLFGGISSAIWRASGINEGLLEQQLSVGISVIALAVVGLVARSNDVESTRFDRRILAMTAVVAGFLSLPPSIHIGSLTIPMPSAVLYALAPMFRAYARFGVVVSLMVTTLAGGGVAALLARRSRRARTMAIGLLAIAAIEYFPALPPSRDALPTAAHRWLAGQDTRKVFDCTARTPGATAGVALLMRAEVGFPAGPLSDCADPELGAKLAAFGYPLLIVRDQTPLREWLISGGSIDGAERRQVFSDASVWTVVASAPAIYVTEMSGFYAREFTAAQSWRWMSKTGRMTVVTSGAVPSIKRLELDIEAYATIRRLQVSVNGHHVDTIVTAPHRQKVLSAPMTFTPGIHTIQFDADDTTMPSAQASSTDTRPLSVRLFSWRFVD